MSRKAAADEQTTTKAISSKQFTALVQAHGQNTKKRQSLAGEIGERVKHAVENANLNRKAYSFICALDRMDEDKRRDVIRSVELYLEFMQPIWGESEHVGDLADQAEGGAEAAGEEDKDLRPPFLKEQNAEAGEKIRKGIKPLKDADAPGTYKLAH